MSFSDSDAACRFLMCLGYEWSGKDHAWALKGECVTSLAEIIEVEGQPVSVRFF